MNKLEGLKDISWNLTNYCLGKCKYCLLWQDKNWRIADELTVKQAEENLLMDSKLDDLTTIHLTGGSPYLSSKFLDVCKLIREYHEGVPVNSPLEGLFPQLYERLFEKVLKWIPEYRVDLALEGAEKKTHEKIRGRDSWVPVLDTFHRLKALGMNIQFEMTIYQENYQDIKAVKEMANHYGVGLYINFGRLSRRFGNVSDGFLEARRDMVDVIEDQLYDIGWFDERILNKQKWILQKANWLGEHVEFDCLMGLRSIDIDPWGNVYPCLMYPEGESFGSLKEFTVSELLTSEKSKEIFDHINARTCQPCPFTCVLHIENLKVVSKKKSKRAKGA